MRLKTNEFQSIFNDGLNGIAGGHTQRGLKETHICTRRTRRKTNRATVQLLKKRHFFTNSFQS